MDFGMICVEISRNFSKNPHLWEKYFYSRTKIRKYFYTGALTPKLCSIYYFNMAKTSRRVDSTLMLTSPKSPKFGRQKITLKCNEKNPVTVVFITFYLSQFQSLFTNQVYFSQPRRYGR